MQKFLFRMEYLSYIEELLNISNPLELNHIHWWLMKYEAEFNNSIDKSNCRKWDKWFKRNEKPFPCVCSTRENDCVFIDLYYELNKITKQEYSSNTEFIEDNLLELVITTQNEPYKKIKLLINLN